MPAKPTALSFLGVAKEATPGTFVASTDYIPVTKFDPKDDTTWLPDGAWRGSMVQTYGKVAGPVWSELSVGGYVYPDTIGYPLAQILGVDTTTGASAPYTHTLQLLNTGDGQPTTQSLNDFNSVDNRGYTDVKWTSLTLSWDGEKYLTWDASGLGLQSATQTKPTASFGTIPGLPGWLSTATIGGTSTATVVSAEVAIKRDGSVIHTADGTQSPYEIFDGPVSVTGKATLIADATTQLTTYLAQAGGGAKSTLVFDWTQGAGASLVELQLTMSSVNFDLVTPNRGKTYVEYDLTFEALGNTTDAVAGYSPLKAVLKNAKVASTYI